MDALSIDDILPVVYSGQFVAVCTPDGFAITDRLAQRPLGDPELAFVMFMVSVARDVLDGRMDGPYSDARAQRIARDRLIPDAVLRADPPLSDEEAADIIGVPEGEIEVARRERGRTHEC